MGRRFVLNNVEKDNLKIVRLKSVLNAKQDARNVQMVFVILAITNIT